MQRATFFTMSLVSLLALAACAQKAPEQAPTEQPKAATEAAFRPTASFKDVMAAEVNPSAEYLWNAVATVSGEKGVEERQPRTDEEWLAAKHQALILLEATNLLLMDGRQIITPGETVKDADLPGINGPEEIRKTIDGDRATFVKLVHALHDAGSEALKAINNKDAKALSDAGAGIDTACENCHLKYWYPASAQAAAATAAPAPAPAEPAKK